MDDARRSGSGIAHLYLEVLSPSLFEVGRLWDSGEMSVAEDHYFTESTQLLISQLHRKIRSAARPKRKLRSIVFSVYGETHVIGARMVSDCLAAEDLVIAVRGEKSLRSRCRIGHPRR